MSNVLQDCRMVQMKAWLEGEGLPEEIQSILAVDGMGGRVIEASLLAKSLNFLLDIAADPLEHAGYILSPRSRS